MFDYFDSLAQAHIRGRLAAGCQALILEDVYIVADLYAVTIAKGPAQAADLVSFAFP